jgi:hypothetical protein
VDRVGDFFKNIIMKKLVNCFFGLFLIVSMAGCKSCSKSEQEQYYTNPDTPSSKADIVLGDGFFGDCSMAKTGTNDIFKIKVKVRGISGLDANGNPVTYIYKSYIWPSISNSTPTYTQSIDIPNTGAFLIDVAIESNSCVKCCTNQTTCQNSFGNVELTASTTINGTIPVSSPIRFSASSFSKTCY